MIDRYESPEDAIPHETTILVLNETDSLFETPPETLFEWVRSEVTCDRLLIEEHYRPADDLPPFDKLIQYQVWIVHHSCLLVEESTPLQSYLSTESFPDETVVIVVLDMEDDRMEEHLRKKIWTEYGDEITVISDETALRYYLHGYLQTANPCSAAGLDYIVSWNNKISDSVGRHQDIQ